MSGKSNPNIVNAVACALMALEHFIEREAGVALTREAVMAAMDAWSNDHTITLLFDDGPPVRGRRAVRVLENNYPLTEGGVSVQSSLDGVLDAVQLQALNETVAKSVTKYGGRYWPPRRMMSVRLEVGHYYYQADGHAQFMALEGMDGGVFVDQRLVDDKSHDERLVPDELRAEAHDLLSRISESLAKRFR